MFCIKCGAENPDGSKFCLKCGSAMVEVKSNRTSTAEINPGQAQNGDLVSTETHQQPIISNPPYQPYINSSQTPVDNNFTVSNYSSNHMKLHCPRCKSSNITSSTQTVVTTKTRGYKGSLGCLGWLLLGPIGLLLGMCGMGSKTKVKEKDYFICCECGKEFWDVDDVLHSLKLNSALFLALGALSILAALGSLSNDASSFVISLLFSVLFVALGVSSIKEHNDVKLNGYDSSYFDKKIDTSNKFDDD